MHLLSWVLGGSHAGPVRVLCIQAFSSDADTYARETKRARRDDGYEEIVVDVKGGRLRYTPRSRLILAECEHHSWCRLPSSLLGGTLAPSRGRPLGRLLAWLDAGDHVDNSDDHHSFDEWLGTANLHCRRVQYRQRFEERATTEPNVAAILAGERLALENEVDGEPAESR